MSLKTEMGFASNLCGEVFTAPPPAGVGTEKYDATGVGMIALLKYGSGVPFCRMQRLESHLGIPLAAATQWQLVSESAAILEPVWVESIRPAAQGRLVHNHDTSMPILSFEREPDDSRTGLFTSGIVSVLAGHRIAACFNGRQHAGENLADLLRRRAAGLTPPIQMCDALSRNRTLNGARSSDRFMSLIHTAELCGSNPFEYLTELLRNPRGLARVSPPERRVSLATHACQKFTLPVNPRCATVASCRARHNPPRSR
jgi:Transposase IS66 family